MEHAFVHRQSRRRARRRPASGMTLIEILIVVAISAIIMIALLSLYMAGQKYFYNQNSRADAIEGSRMPMTWISRDVRDANQVHDTAVTAYNGTSYNSGANTIVLDTPSIDVSGLIITGSTDYIIYTYDATTRRLLRIVSPTAGVRSNDTRIMADNLVGTPFALTYYDQNGNVITSTLSNAFTVEIELTAQSRAIQRGGQNFVETVRTQAKLRNKNIPY